MRTSSKRRPGQHATVAVVDTLVVKVSSRCNLDCPYCYVYHQGDDSYRQQTKQMTEATARVIIRQASVHASTHQLQRFTFVFHGGEPLLASPRFFQFFVAAARQQFPATVKLIFAVQTNGVLLTEAWCQLFAGLSVQIGISIDGVAQTNHRYRIDHRGQSQHTAILQGYYQARRLGQPGVLSVIDITADPLETYQYFRQLRVGLLDLMLPNVTHDARPIHWSAHDTPYADWLISVFDGWFQDHSERPLIRMFVQLINLILGHDEQVSYFGTDTSPVAVIDTDGHIGPNDALKICGNGFTQTGLSVYEHSLDEALRHERIALSIFAQQRLSFVYRSCLIRDVCGGGYLPHRYARQSGFDNPSVYCRDLMKLITHIQNTLLAGLPAAFKASRGLTRLSEK